MEDNTKKADYRVNILVVVILAFLTAGEYYLGVISTTNIAGLMIGIGLLKAYFIVKDYMHIGRVFSGDEEH
ncbi:MAG TPA: hypothetical protein PK530_15060 [Anaerolineales bacterium]|nr:hypothetical protein [Anaerolineales bacterium]